MLLTRRIRYLTKAQSKKGVKTLVDFHKVYTKFATPEELWFGVPIQKMPTDLWIYQELINELRPDLIIETGTYYGGTALYLAMVCAALHYGEVVTIDINQKTYYTHNLVKRITGSSVSPQVYAQVLKLAKNKRVMVVLDSSKTKKHVLKELELYSPLIPVDGYIIVEHTTKRGVKGALLEFLKNNRKFESDRAREKFMLTDNPAGYLRRIK